MHRIRNRPFSKHIMAESDSIYTDVAQCPAGNQGVDGLRGMRRYI
jgi:hypothetical protein